MAAFEKKADEITVHVYQSAADSLPNGISKISLNGPDKQDSQSSCSNSTFADIEMQYGIADYKAAAVDQVK